jgi:hypothetical protein
MRHLKEKQSRCTSTNHLSIIGTQVDKEEEEHNTKEPPRVSSIYALLN